MNAKYFLIVFMGLVACLCYAVAQERPQTRTAASIANSGDAAKATAKKSAARSVGHSMFESPHASPIAVRGGDVFVVNTPCGTLDVIDAASRSIRARVRVGVEPVSVALRPDGEEVWVSNHVSDSVSVIDNDAWEHSI